MKRILLITLFIVGFTSAIHAEEMEDSIDYYIQRISDDYQLENYQDASLCFKNLLRIYQKVNGDISHDSDYAHLESAYANLCYQLGDYPEAIRLGSDALEIRKNVLGVDNPDYATSLGNLALFYSDFGDNREAIRLGTEAADIKKRLLGENHPDYATALDNLAGYYSNLGDNHEAIRLGSEAMEILKNELGTDHPDYAISLNNLAEYYYNIDDYNQAIRLGAEALLIRKKTLGINHPDYIESLDNLANYYTHLGDDFEAIRLSNEALEIRKKVFGVNHPEYINSLIILADYYSYFGDFGKAILLGSEALEIRKKLLGANHPDYASSLSKLAGYYSSLGNDSLAIQLETEALNIRKSVLGVNHPDYAKSLGNIASYYSYLSDYSKAIGFGTEALEITKNTLGECHPDYAALLDMLALVYSNLGNYSTAIQLEKKAIEIRTEVLGKENPAYLGNLALYYFYNGDNSEAIRIGNNVLELRKRILGTNHIDYAKALGNLASFYYKTGDYKNAIPLLKECVPIVRDNVFKAFSGITTNERFLYWGLYDNIFNSIVPKMIINSKDLDAPSILYNNTALFSKGLLLSTEQEMTKIIQESDDAEALQMYLELKQNRQMLNVLYSKPIAERYLNCDSLERVSSDLERQIISHVKDFGDYTRNLSITWKDVQNKLDDSDIAVEFLSYRDNDEATTYIALTLCKNDTAPVLTPLFTNLQLMDVAGNGDTYQNAAADELIWGPLASRMEGKSHVYFSATGMLHNIGIEYLPSIEGKDCYRLSSTRELVTHKPSEGGKNATLFGGIDYDATYASLESIVKSEPSTTYLAENTMPLPTGKNRGGLNYSTMRGTRYAVSPLPYSKTEVQEISAFLKKKGFVVQEYDTIRATEESFKALTGQRKSLIHISTHGFYYDEEEAENKAEHMRMMLMGENRPSLVEDLSLLRCGLCFAGANQTFTGDSLPTDGQDDGILNALEIAQTDLRGLDLVVLSACQTALGDVVNGEGVFGLQRGFKKAGANSILMSLWEVDDEVTSKFMIEFYRQWTAGKTKMEALKKAQSVIKQEYPDPQHWAAFILLDALD